MSFTFESAPDELESFACYTLVDITNTGVNDPINNIPYQQSQNLNTLIQCIGLRALPLMIEVTQLEKQNLKKYKFGSDYKGQSTVWCLTWKSDREGYFQVKHLVEDSEGLPIHSNLTETVPLPTQVLESRDAKLINLYFEVTNNKDQHK
jgi:hypothetical protein